MLRKQGERLELYPWMVRYIQHGEEHEQWALPDKEWWTDFAEKWEHTEIVEFVEVELTNEQLARAEEIEQLRISEAHRDICIDYILEGAFPDGIDHPLRNLQLQKIDEAREDSLKADNLILMDALATTFEEILMLREELAGGGK